MADRYDLTANVTEMSGSSSSNNSIVVQSNVTESSTVTANVIGGGIGPRGETGADGVDGRNPMTVAETAPASPQEGDLWYQP